MLLCWISCYISAQAIFFDCWMKLLWQPDRPKGWWRDASLGDVGVEKVVDLFVQIPMKMSGKLILMSNIISVCRISVLHIFRQCNIWLVIHTTCNILHYVYIWIQNITYNYIILLTLKQDGLWLLHYCEHTIHEMKWRAKKKEMEDRPSGV